MKRINWWKSIMGMSVLMNVVLWGGELVVSASKRSDVDFYLAIIWTASLSIVIAGNWPWLKRSQDSA